MTNFEKEELPELPKTELESWLNSTPELPTNYDIQQNMFDKELEPKTPDYVARETQTKLTYQWEWKF